MHELKMNTTETLPDNMSRALIRTEGISASVYDFSFYKDGLFLMGDYSTGRNYYMKPEEVEGWLYARDVGGLYCPEQVWDILVEALSEALSEDGALAGASPAEVAEWLGGKGLK